MGSCPCRSSTPSGGTTACSAGLAITPTRGVPLGSHQNESEIRHPKQEVRQMTWNKAVKEVAEAGHEGAVIRRLQKLLAT